MIMCSQFENKALITDLLSTTNSTIKDKEANLAWNSHVYPHSEAPVVTRTQSQNMLQLMSYSLIPFWSKVAKPSFSTYNARLDRPNKISNKLELIYNAPAWKIPFSRQRCIVPLTGFFESCQYGSYKGNIVKFSADNSEQILLAAGIWDTWTDSNTGKAINSFAIITDNPCDHIIEVGHDRQPVFLSIDNANIWLDDDTFPAPLAYKFLKQNQLPINYSVFIHAALKGFIKEDLFSIL